MDVLTVKEDLVVEGETLLKAGVAYQPKGTEVNDGIEYTVYATEIPDREILLPTDR